MGSKSQPQAPDYMSLAREQAADNASLTAQQNWANRPTQNTPWGSTSWETNQAIDPGTGLPITQWTQNQTLDPQLQYALDQQMGLQEQRSGLAGSFMSRVAGDMGNAFDWNKINAYTPMGHVVDPNPFMTAGNYFQTKSNVPEQSLDSHTPTQLTHGFEKINATGQDTQGLQQTTQTTNAPAFSADRQRIEESLYQRMAPVHESQMAQMQTQLANQGITPGSDAYKQQMQTLMDNQARERFNAVQQGGQEQKNMQDMLLSQQQQAFGQQGASQQARNQALQNLFGQNQGVGQFGLGAEQQAFGQDLAGQQGGNAAKQAQFQQGLTNAQLYNQAMQQNFGQNLSANAQNFQQGIASQQYQNQLRQQAISEESARRNMSLNEMNALLTGQQVQAPQMPGFNPNTKSDAADLLKAGGMTGQAQLDAANAKQQGQQGMMSGLMGLGSGAMMM